MMPVQKRPVSVFSAETILQQGAHTKLQGFRKSPGRKKLKVGRSSGAKGLFTWSMRARQLRRQGQTGVGRVRETWWGIVSKGGRMDGSWWLKGSTV